MKTYKQLKALLGVMAVISILPGCGSNSGSNDVSASGSTSASIGLTGQCYYMNGTVSPGSGATLTFASNQGEIGENGAIQAVVTGASLSFPGTTYTRSNSAGDSMDVWVSNNAPGYTQVEVVAYLSPSTVEYFQAYNMPVCGLYIDSYVAGNQLTLSSPYLTQSSGYGGGYGSYGGYSAAGISL